MMEMDRHVACFALTSIPFGRFNINLDISLRFGNIARVFNLSARNGARSSIKMGIELKKEKNERKIRYERFVPLYSNRFQLRKGSVNCSSSIG